MSAYSPWCAAVQTIKDDAEDLFSTLHTICDEVGFNEDTRKMFYDQAYQHFRSLIKDMRDEIVAKKDDMLKAINLLMEEVDKLSKELKIDPGLDDFNDVPLVDVTTKLKAQTEILKRTKEQRLKYLEEFMQKEQVICKSMGVQPIGIVEGNEGLPSNEDLENFKLYLQKQESEKNRLENTFKDMRRSIMKMMDELSITPALDFELLVCNNQENFVYTASNMLKLRELRDNLKDNLDAAKEKAALKREELVELWKFLEVPVTSSQIFLEQYSGHSLGDIHALNEEIKRCKQQRTENIAKYVEKTREQLEELWDKCRLSDEQRKEFKPFYVETYTENLLTLHDLEVERLRKFYNANKKIFDLLNEWECLWDKVKEIDQRAQDPERLHNRGGQLLIEEKERKAFHKKLPKIEEQLRILIEQYENNTGLPFTINGKAYGDFLAQSWVDYLEAKETMKKARAKAKDKSIKKTPLMSTSRRTPATTISMLRPCTSTKRRDEKSPLNAPAKRRLIQSDKTRPTVCTSRVRHSGRVSRRLLASSKALNTSNRSTRKAESANDTQNTIGSVAQYEQFQEHLAQRDELRSSVLPDEVLRTFRSKTKMRTPVKTPVKPMRKNLSAANTPNKTPKTSHVRESSRSPRLMNTPRLATAPSTMPIFF